MQTFKEVLSSPPAQKRFKFMATFGLPGSKNSGKKSFIIKAPDAKKAIGLVFKQLSPELKKKKPSIELIGEL